MGRRGKRTNGGSACARRRSCRGAAAVELALCLPLLLTLALGAIETCNVIYVRTLMQSVAYEGARMATRPTTAAKAAATSSDVTTRCGTLLTQVGVQGATVTVQAQDFVTSQNKNFSSTNPQDLVSVSITAPLSQNVITSLVVPTSLTVSAKTTLVVE